MKALVRYPTVMTVTFLTGLGLNICWGQIDSPDITAPELETHVRYLASDELQGRGSGSEGNRKAAEYIASEFRTYGLTPGGDNGTYFQMFEFVSAVEMGIKNSLSFSGEALEEEIVLAPEDEFRPLGFTMNGRVNAPVVFAGYGISAPEKDYDDYANVDVEGKIVLVLRYSPEGNDPHGDFFPHSTLRSKARNAREHGAAGMMVVTGATDDPDDELIRLSYDQLFAHSGILALSVKRSAVEKVLGTGEASLSALQERIQSSHQPLSFAIPGVTGNLETGVSHTMATTSNIIGYLPGNEPKLKNEAVVIGAHMDHLGLGGINSGSLTPDTIAIHNGADDNASGTAALLELAEAFSLRRHNKRGIVFIAFSGEELGTLGSRHYVEHPFVPLEETIAMINMDMIGRLQNNTLTIHGVGTSPVWDSMITKHSPDPSLSVKEVEDGYGPSDHSQFYGKGIPVLFFFTGIHSDYHKPTDDWEKLNYPALERIANYVYSLSSDLLSTIERPVFSKTQSLPPAASSGDARSFAVTLGVIPDYSATVEGMALGGVRPGGPAEKAGLRGGDTIVRMKGKEVLNIYDYMTILGGLKAGEKVLVEAVREGVLMSFEVETEQRK